MRIPRLAPILVIAGLAAAAAPAAQAAPKACKTAQLVTWVDNIQGAAGTEFYDLNFTNLGATCTLRGFPGVSAVGAHGNQLGKAAGKDKSGKVKTITLKAANPRTGAFNTAHAVLGITEAANFPTSACKPAFASGVRVYPPNQKASAFVPFPFDACTTGQSFLSIRPVTK